LLWFNKRGWFERPNPFFPIVYRQFFERQEHWKEIKNRPAERETLTAIFLKAQKEHPEVEDFQPMMHSAAVVAAATEATYVSIL
jgi:hypothetical protein